MNKLKQMGLLSCALVMGFLHVSAYAKGVGAYIQLSSSVTQAARGATNVATFDTVAGKQGIEQIRDKVTFHEDGIYFVMASGQIGGMEHDSTATGNVDLWMFQNGKPLPNTTSRQSVSRGATSALIIQNVVSVKAGDTVGIGFSANNPLLGLLFLPATQNVPAISSIVLTVYKIV